jgi:hypothetical protein
MRRRHIDKQTSPLSGTLPALLTLSICSACWFSTYIDTTRFPPMQRETQLSRLMAHLLGNEWPAGLTALLLTLFAGYIMQRLSDRETLIRKYTRLPFMLFSLLVSLSAGLLPASAVVVVPVCFIYIIRELFGSWQLPDASIRLFNAGALTAVATLFMPPVICCIPLLWIGMYQMRALCLRTLTASFAGVCAVYWIVAAGCLWLHDFSAITSFASGLADFNPQLFKLFQPHRAGLTVVLVMLAAALFHIRRESGGSSLRVRQMLAFLITMTAWSLALFLLYGDAFLPIVYLSASVPVACLLENVKRSMCLLLFYFLLSVGIACFLLRLWTS